MNVILNNEELCPKMLSSYAYIPGSGRLGHLRCKARNCETCGKFWAYKYRQALREIAKPKIDQSTGEVVEAPDYSRAITLTTSYNCGKEKLWAALRYFWQLVRKEFGRGVEYFGVVEFNQKHTQPHIHFILSNSQYMPWAVLVGFWKKAQRMAKFEQIAFNVRIEKIRSNIATYFTKYITKLTGGGKDEIPRRENWKGRYVRYSNGFFGVAVTAIIQAIRLRSECEQGKFYRAYGLVKGGDSISEFVIDCVVNEKQLKEIVCAPWNWLEDKKRAIPLDPQSSFIV